MSNTKQAIQDYEQMLVNASAYRGNKKKDLKIFSASMLGNDPLQNFLKLKHGSKDSIQFEANTLGSIYQLGVDAAATQWNDEHRENIPNRYINSLRLSYLLPNGWTISGELDQLDTLLKVIFDNKVSTATTVTKVPKEGKNHGYALQQAVYKFLLHKYEIEKGIEPAEYSAVLPIVDKGFSYFKTNKTNQLNFVELELYSITEIEQMLIKATNELQQYIDLDQEPDKCAELWWFGRKGETKKAMKCIHYCDQNGNCKHFNNDNAAKNMILDNL